MTALDDLATVVALACNVEDRTDSEQDALLRCAAKCDSGLNALVVTNQREGPPSRLYLEVGSTRVLVDDQRDRRNAKTAEKLEAQAQRWETRT